MCRCKLHGRNLNVHRTVFGHIRWQGYRHIEFVYVLLAYGIPYILSQYHILVVLAQVQLFRQALGRISGRLLYLRSIRYA